MRRQTRSTIGKPGEGTDVKPVKSARGQRGQRALNKTTAAEMDEPKESQQKEEESSPETPELYPDVLEHLFSYMDTKSLKETARFVSKSWNEEAQKVIGKRISVKLTWDFSEDQGVKTRKRQTKKTITEDTSQKRLNRFNSMLSGCESPQSFVNWTVHKEWLQEPKFMKLLEKYGHHLKSLDITSGCSSKEADSTVLDKVHKILTELCPNLTIFHLNIGLAWDPKIQHSSSFPDFDTPLKLETLELVGPVIPISPKFCFDILKASPNLKKLLTVPAFKWTCCNLIHLNISRSKPANFFEMLPSLNEFTEKLEDIGWTNDIPLEVASASAVSERLTNISSLQKSFSTLKCGNTLKTLRIGSLDTFVHPNNNYLLEILSNYAQDLEKLYLTGNKIRQDRYYKSIEFPTMPNLKHLTISSPDFYGLRIFSLLDKLPNLETFEHQSNVTHNVQSSTNLFGDEFETKVNINRNLKKFYLDMPFFEIHPFTSIVERLPCIEYLRIVVDQKDEDGGGGNEFKEVFSAASKLKNLRSFEICVGPKYQSLRGLCQALEVVSEFAKLQQLTISSRTLNFTVSIGVEVKMAILKLQDQLFKISLKIRSMKNRFPEWEITKYANENNVQLKQIHS